MTGHLLDHVLGSVPPTGPDVAPSYDWDAVRARAEATERRESDWTGIAAVLGAAAAVLVLSELR